MACFGFCGSKADKRQKNRGPLTYAARSDGQARRPYGAAGSGANSSIAERNRRQLAA